VKNRILFTAMKRTSILIVSLVSLAYINAQIPEKKIYQTKFVETSPVIDGKEDDCWNLVDWESGFIQIQPAENKPPSQETRFKILFDDNNLYVFIRAFDTEAEKISRIMSRRDNFDGDMIEINIDSYFDKQTAFSFTAMASGAKGDEFVSQNGNNWDSSWNPIWFLGTSVDGEGWTAEMRIPYSQLRFGRKDEQVWGIQVMRHLYRLEERSTWQYIPKGSPGQVHLFGELHGIKNIKPRKRVELLPYAVVRTERFEKVEGNPFLNGKANGLSAGFDGKFGITNDLTLDVTINPDFGQVEADPSEVNLSAFETYFSERRPFFIEGKNIYQFPPYQTNVIHNMQSDNLFYSRRIGRYPHSFPSVSGDEYVDMPESTTILGAAKLSGKTRNGLSVGIMESVTSQEYAVIDDEGERRKEPVEPLTNYFVGRLQKDFNKGETVLGGMVTSVNRDIYTQSLRFLSASAITGGLDVKHYWNERTWYLSGSTIFSNIRGSESAITALQTTSARYYQRPNDYLSVDSSLTELSGLGGSVKFGRSSKKKIQFETSLSVRSPGLELNDIGYMRYSDVIHHGSWVAYYIRNPFAIFNNFYLNTNYWMYLDLSGKLLSFSTNMNFNSQFKNRWRFNGSFTRQSINTSRSLLRGGPYFRYPGDMGINLNIQSDPSKKVFAYIGSYHDIGDSGSQRVHDYWAGFELKPLNTLSISMDPEFIFQNIKLQYLSTLSFSGEARYLFGELDQRTLSTTIRINFTINPELTIEYYGQPYISAGKYNNFKMISNTRADQFKDSYCMYSDTEINLDEVTGIYHVDENNDNSVDYSFKNPDFNFRQFRSNLVVRWEYSPGSTLYVVWSQGRTSSASEGIYSFRNDVRELFDVHPRNIFLLKLSYMFSL
jgi:hypothetical protein